ncbi:unnamed protein product [Cuscuta epithymum]|uniref:HAT C-terminal dimerisation domain-containing protein n=1 Tax=Cuscuta epithymum TaxID=186058 RepID=A0AAV0ESY5_9ASTE|nr:unnamed protein product [Cuscuta epithymum]
MKSKLDKYWGDPEKMNMLIFFANVLDPRDKYEYMPHQLNALYGDKIGEAFFAKIKLGLIELYGDYVTNYDVSVSGSSQLTPNSVSLQSESSGSRPVSKFKAQLKKQKQDSGLSGLKKNELELYLSENILEEDNEFDILRWWKLNSERFPILSKMARDILVVPISTVASESTFSTSGRVLDCFRSSLSAKIVEALICAQDWLRMSNQPVSVEENIEEVDRLETGTYFYIFSIQYLYMMLLLT